MEAVLISRPIVSVTHSEKAGPGCGWGRLLRTPGAALFLAACALTLFPPLGAKGNSIHVGQPLPPWEPGTLDIHQIATGRGNSALLLCPDGTSVMIDAGASNDGPDVSLPLRPNPSRRAGEWLGRYALRQLRPTGRSALDFFVVTHFHPDHLGDVGPATPASTRGEYRLTGLTDVAEVIPIHRLIDRGFPHYAYPTPLGAASSSYPQQVFSRFAANYLHYVAWRTAHGETCEQIRVGAADQLVLRWRPEAFPGFEIRTLAANGVIWTGQGTAVKSPVPPLGQLAPADYPDENLCSIALRLRFGRFSYYTGGDLACSDHDGEEPWRDVETPVAQVAGRVCVAVANHHGYYDANGPRFVRALAPKVVIIPSWHLSHPDIAVLDHLLSERLAPGPRAVFATGLMPANRLVNARFVPQLKSTDGNIVVRVAADEASFQVIVTDNRDESDTVTGVFGPYDCP